ncbi:MAG: NUDIX hydrolase [Dehalococcoidia bacterium]
MSEHKEIIPVVAACIKDVRPPLRILLHLKNESHDERGTPRNPELVGTWEFPGGMVEYGEDPEEALARECREELNGQKIKIGRLLHATTNIFKDGVHYLVLYYECEFPALYTPTPPGSQWATPEEIMEMNCLPGTYEVIKKFYLY